MVSRNSPKNFPKISQSTTTNTSSGGKTMSSPSITHSPSLNGHPMATTKSLRQKKRRLGSSTLQMLTCYDYPLAQMLNETNVDCLLVGDSLGNVVLGLDHTIGVTLDMMILFAQAVKRGASHKFIIVDLPFGSYSHFHQAIENSIRLFQQTQAQALKLEGGEIFHCEIIERLTQIGIPIMGHIGLRPQSVHQQGGYYRHGKQEEEANKLLEEAIRLEKAGIFALVLECIHEQTAAMITEKLSIPTIGIGSGSLTDGQVLVTHDLLGEGKNPPPSFVRPMLDLYQLKKATLHEYLKQH
jgi:3-methyl-2-oxobutanoate hydroxymethyltransferase